MRFAGTVLAALTAFGGFLPLPVQAQTTFNGIVDEITHRPIFAHSWIGVEVYSLDSKKTLFALNENKFFTPGSTTKVVTEGAALALLGPDYRFHTRVYRTGPVKQGVLEGDLVLVASGDPNLSGRLQPDGMLAFTNDDHSYGGPALPGNPVAPITALAEQVAKAGIHRIAGRVLVDVSLFREGIREVGSNTVVSPICVNDNVIDVQATPGAVGSPAQLHPSPAVPYIHFVDHVVTAPSSEETHLSYIATTFPDGTVRVDVNGVEAAGHGPSNLAYPVDKPSVFAATIFSDELKKQGVMVSGTPWKTSALQADANFASYYNDAHRVAEFTSAPLSEDIHVTLKVSQNLHAMMMPYIIGSVLDHAHGDSNEQGFAQMHDWLARAGLDLSGAAQWDGEGDAAWTPHFMTRYLAYLPTAPNFKVFYDALPIMGRDGTLSDMIPQSKAAGQIRAKTGTNMEADLLNNGVFVEGKGLVGYTTTPSGERVAIAVYLNKVPVAAGPDGKPSALARYNEIVGGANAEIAAAAHLLPIVSDH